eukprot:8353083-Heterocapsa_arctica.AAC.1
MSSVRERQNLVKEAMAAELRVLEMRARMLQQEILNSEEIHDMPPENSSQDGVDEELPRERVPEFFGIVDQDVE